MGKRGAWKAPLHFTFLGFIPCQTFNFFALKILACVLCQLALYALVYISTSKSHIQNILLYFNILSIHSCTNYWSTASVFNKAILLYLKEIMFYSLVNVSQAFIRYTLLFPRLWSRRHLCCVKKKCRPLYTYKLLCYVFPTRHRFLLTSPKTGAPRSAESSTGHGNCHKLCEW